MNVSSLQDVFREQSLEVMFEYMQKPAKIIVIKSNIIMADFRKRKNKGIPGPKKESCLVSMLQSV